MKDVGILLQIKVPRAKPRPRTPSPPRHEPEVCHPLFSGGVTFVFFSCSNQWRCVQYKTYSQVVILVLQEPRRYSCPPTRFGYYPPPHDQIPRADHSNVPQVNMPYPPPPQVSPYSFHQPWSADEFAPTAPPADLAQHSQEEAHGAPPPTKHRPQAYVPELRGYLRSFHD